MPVVTEDKPVDINRSVPANSEQLAREEAIKQIERKRRFWMRTVWGAIALILLTAVWAMSEYQNAGGWPMHGFSQSSGIHEVWNLWIVYPFIGWVLLTTAAAWEVYLHKPISEREIQREIERRAGPPH